MSELAVSGGKPVSERPIPIASPVFSEEEINDVVQVLRSGNVRQGPRVAEFEEEFANAVGSKYAYAVSSGTAALHLAYLSLLKPGDEVIVPAFTFIATAAAAVFANAKPVFADIDPETLTISIEDAKRKITPRTKAIAPVHLFGNACDMDAVGRLAADHGLFIISDLAQSHLTKINGKDVGSFDHLNCYSFYATKNMTTGEGGMVTTNSEELLEKGRMLRSHGQAKKYYHTSLGLNYRMTDLAAVIGLRQLANLPADTLKRRQNADYLSTGLSRLDGIRVPVVKAGVEHSFHQYSILLDTSGFSCSRDDFVKALNAENIGCAVHYPIPLSKQPAFQDGATPCPVAEDMAQRILSLPVHPRLSQEDLAAIVAGVDKVVSYYRR